LLARLGRFLDLVHWFMADRYPRSVVAHGGVFTWPDGRLGPVYVASSLTGRVAP
jgi:hypothetical protein